MGKKQRLEIYRITEISHRALNRTFHRHLWNILGTSPTQETFIWVDDDTVYLPGTDQSNGTYMQLPIMDMAGGYMILEISSLPAVCARLQSAGLTELFEADESDRQQEMTFRQHVKPAKCQTTISGVEISFVERKR